MEVSAGLPVAALALDDVAFADVTIAVVADDAAGRVLHRIPAHRVLLSRLSAYFDRALRYHGGGGGGGDYTLRVPASCAPHVATVKRYLYGAPVSLSAANSVQLLVLADYLQVQPLYSAALAFVSVAVRHDAASLLAVFDAAAELQLELVADVCTHAALTTCWGPLLQLVRAPAPPRGVPAGLAVVLAHHQCLTVARHIAAATNAAGSGGGAGGGMLFDSGLPVGAAGAAVVASAVAHSVAGAPTGAAARALSAGGIVPAAPGRGAVGGAAWAGLVGGGDVEASSRHWLRSHLGGLLRTSAAFPRSVRGAGAGAALALAHGADDSGAPGSSTGSVAGARAGGRHPPAAAAGGCASRSAGGGDAAAAAGGAAAEEPGVHTVWLASARSESDRLARWEARQQQRRLQQQAGRAAVSSGCVGDEAGDDDDDEEEEDEDATPIEAVAAAAARVHAHVARVSAPLRTRFTQQPPPLQQQQLSASDVLRLRADASDLLGAALAAHTHRPPRAPGVAAAAAPPELVRSFLVEATDLLSLATVVPVLRGDVVWRLFACALSSFVAVDGAGASSLSAADGALLEALGAAVAMAFGSAHVRRGVSACLEVAHTGGRPSAARAAQPDDDVTETAMVPSTLGAFPQVVARMPRSDSRGSLGSEPGLEASHAEAPAAAAEEGGEVEGDSDAAAGGGPATAAGGAEGPPSEPSAPLPWPHAGRHVLPLVLHRDELRVRCEDEVVALAMDAVIESWLGTPLAALAVAQARDEHSVSDAERAQCADARAQTAALWRCVRWEHVSAAAWAAAVAAVQLLCSQGAVGDGALRPAPAVDIGVALADLRWAYSLHHLGVVITTPAAAIAAGLRPPRISYAGRPRIRLLGGGALEVGAEQQQRAGELAPTATSSAPSAPLATPPLLRPQRQLPAAAASLEDPPPSLDVGMAAGQLSDAATAALLASPPPLPSSASSPSMPSPLRPWRVVFGAHEVQLHSYPVMPPMLMDSSPSSRPPPAAAASDGFAVAAAAAAHQLRDDDAPPHHAASLSVAAESAVLAGASASTVNRLLRVHHRRHRRHQRAGGGGAGGGGGDGGGGWDEPHATSPSESPLVGDSGRGAVSLPSDVEATPLLLPLVALPLPDAPAPLQLGPPAHLPPLAPRPQRAPAPSPPAGALALQPLPLAPSAGGGRSTRGGDPPLAPAAAAAQEAAAAAAAAAQEAAGAAVAAAEPLLPWPPSPALYQALFGGGALHEEPPGGAAAAEPAGGRLGDAAMDAAVVQRLRERAGMVREAYEDVFRHISVRRGWRSLPFTPAHAAPAFEAAAQVVTLVRHAVDTHWRPGFRIRQVDGQAQSLLWGLAAPPAGAGRGLRAWQDELLRRLVHATLSDGTGAYTDELDAATVDAALAGHPDSGASSRET